MKCLLSVCLAIAAGSAAYVFQNEGKTPTLRPGVSVQMAVTQSAVAVPAADEEDAWVVSVTRKGDIFFGVDKLSPEGLTEKMTRTPRNRDAKLYVKADAGAPFSTVRQVLLAARADLFDDVVLLTAQPKAAQPGTIVPPKGLDVWIGSEAGSNFVAVQIESNEGSSTMKVNNEVISSSGLQAKMAKVFDNRSEGRLVVLKADARVRYWQVVQAIDSCQAAGASRISVIVSPEV